MLGSDAGVLGFSNAWGLADTARDHEPSPAATGSALAEGLMRPSTTPYCALQRASSAVLPRQLYGRQGDSIGIATPRIGYYLGRITCAMASATFSHPQKQISLIRTALTGHAPHQFAVHLTVHTLLPPFGLWAHCGLS